MRVFIILLFICRFNLILCQITDNFSDGDFNSNPEWFGDTSEFRVTNEVLFLDAPQISDTSLLVLFSNISAKAEWSIKIGLNFNPSSSNFARVYLISDNIDFRKNLNGYYLKIGGSNDDVSLYRQDQDNHVLIIEGRKGKLNLNQNEARIRISRDSNYLWRLEIDSTGAFDYLFEGMVIDSSHRISKSFGVFCKYTSTRSDKFYFDDIYINGTQYLDEIPPSITHDSIISSNSWRLFFNEQLDTSYFKSNYFNHPEYKVSKIIYDSILNCLNLIFNTNFNHGEFIELKVDSLRDLSGNIMISRILKALFNYPDSFRTKDIVFNELMPDPEPFVGLPQSEFIELFNRTDNYINLENWQIADLSDTSFLPYFIIHPKSYIVLTHEKDSDLWAEFDIPIINLLLPSLNNSEDRFILLLPDSKPIDSVRYYINQFPEEKQNGGWSLELVNPNFICYNNSNWKASIDNLGGSPGKINSISKNDTVGDFIQFEKILAFSDSGLKIKLSAPLNPISIRTKNLHFLPEISVNEIKLLDDILDITLGEGFTENKNYEISLLNSSNCFDEIIDIITFDFVFPAKTQPGDLVINEILFNPQSGGSDFIEIYNVSSSYLDITELSILNHAGDTNKMFDPLKRAPEIIHPGQYMAFSEDSADIVERFISANPFNIRNANLASMPDKNGTVTLLNSNMQKIDEVNYDESLHFPLVENAEGKSIERINFKKSSTDKDNWTTASENSGFATPGAKNSHNIIGGNNYFEAVPGIFSPDNDGYNDLTKIEFLTNESGYTGSLTIYSDTGIPIRKLIENKLLNASDFIIWDGTNDEQLKVENGYYLIVFELTMKDGSVKTEKTTVVVASK